MSTAENKTSKAAATAATAATAAVNVTHMVEAATENFAKLVNEVERFNHSMHKQSLIYNKNT